MACFTLGEVLNWEGLDELHSANLANSRTSVVFSKESLTPRQQAMVMCDARVFCIIGRGVGRCFAMGGGGGGGALVTHGCKATANQERCLKRGPEGTSLVSRGHRRREREENFSSLFHVKSN